jgi:hypothetical protein
MIQNLFNNPGSLFWVCIMAIPVTAILVGGIQSITSSLIKHRERMAMIERGMHPDGPRQTREGVRQ